MKKNFSGILKINWILLGLVMLIPALLKLFVMGPNKIIGMFTGLGFPAPAFFAWILMIAELLFGVMILTKHKMDIAAKGAAIIILVAGLTFWTYGPGTTNGVNWPQVLVHLTLASNFWVLGSRN